MERHRMLMVMIPRTDHGFWNNHDHGVARQPPNTVDQKVDSEVDHAEHDYKQDRNSIRGISKHNNLRGQEALDSFIGNNELTQGAKPTIGTSTMRGQHNLIDTVLPGQAFDFALPRKPAPFDNQCHRQKFKFKDLPLGTD
ncbi:hypothetical protein N8198_05250 [Gammaproteobacteria bacterium]|nr:hypothetical protein [Gammaproteobacteria bacterium]